MSNFKFMLRKENGTQGEALFYHSVGEGGFLTCVFVPAGFIPMGVGDDRKPTETDTIAVTLKERVQDVEVRPVQLRLAKKVTVKNANGKNVDVAVIEEGVAVESNVRFFLRDKEEVENFHNFLKTNLI